MKRRLLPREYTYSMANTVGGFLIIIVVLLFLIITNNSKHPIEVSLWLKVAIPIITFAAVLILVDLKTSMGIKKQIKQRDMLIKNKKPLCGKIEEIKRFRIDRHGCISNTVENSSRCVYQLVVSYIDPADGKQKTALSEYYKENLFTCLADDYAEVYVLSDIGYVLIDGLHIREFGGSKIALKNDEHNVYNSDINYYIDIYGKIIYPITAVLGIIIAIIIFIFVKSILKR